MGTNDIINVTNISGTLQTSSQPNITSVGTLTSLNMGGNIDLGSNDITNVNSLTSTNLTGTLQTGSQPNITSVGTLTSLTLGGNLDLGTNDIINVTNISGTLQTSSQPNITSVGTLTGLLVDGSITSKDRYVLDDSLNTVYTRTLGSGGVYFLQIGTTNTTGSSADFFIGDMLQSSTVSTRKFMIKSDGKVGIGTDTPSTELEVVGDIVGTNLTGTLQTGVQGNIISVGTLTSLNMGGNIDLGSNDIVNVTNISGTLQTGVQGNITSVGTLTSLNMGGNIDLGSNDIVNVNSLTSTNLTGTLQTGVQPNITSVGTLTSLNITGDLTVDTNTLNVDSTNNSVGINFTPSSTNTLSVGGNIKLENFGKIVGDDFTSLEIVSNGNNLNEGLILYNNNGVNDTAKININEDNYISFETNETEKMRIDTDGNVGIGTSVPGDKLDVNGGVMIRGNLKMENSGVINGDDNNSLIITSYGNNNNEGLILQNDNTGGTITAKIDVNVDSYISFDTDEVERMIIQNDGNVIVNEGLYSKNIFLFTSKNTSQVISNNTETSVDFQTPVTNNGFSSDTGTSFTFPETGLYQVIYNVTYATKTSGYRKAFIRLTGTGVNPSVGGYSYLGEPAGSPEPASLSGSMFVNVVNTSTTCELRVFQISGGNLSIGGTLVDYLQIYKVGSNY